MTEFVLCLWLAISPATLTPLSWHADSAQCVRARKSDIDASLQAGARGGATYLCAKGQTCMAQPEPPVQYTIPVVTTRAILEGK